MERPDVLDRGEPARLIPVTADTNREGRAASIFLATLMAVPSFARELFSTIGQRVGVRSGLQCFTEIRFKNENNINFRPDGLIVLDGGRGRTWNCLIEAKIGNAELTTEQVEAYLQLARDNNVQAVLTISNQFAALPTHSPVKVSKILTRNVELFHWSWIHLKTVAHLLLHDDAFESPEQKFILSEFHRYFDHDSVGVSRFDRMNSEWKDIVAQVIANAALNKTSPIVENTIGAWHQETRDLCLLMTQKVRRPVRLYLSRAHANDPIQRVKDDCEQLAAKRELTCTLEVPDAAAPLAVAANLSRRSISVSMSLSAPKDKQRASSRINWLLRQLAKVAPDDIYIRCNWPGRATHTQAGLNQARNNPDCLLSGNESLVPLSFDIILVRDIASKFSGARTFLEQLELIVPYFYAEVGERLKPYVPSPPRLLAAVDDEDAEGNLPTTKKAASAVSAAPVVISLTDMLSIEEPTEPSQPPPATDSDAATPEQG